MNEDDTFDLLRRKSLRQVYLEFRAGDMSGILALYNHMQSNHWTVRDYLNEYMKDNPPLRNLTAEESIEFYMNMYTEQLSEYYGIIIE